MKNRVILNTLMLKMQKSHLKFMTYIGGLVGFDLAN